MKTRACVVRARIDRPTAGVLITMQSIYSPRRPGAQGIWVMDMGSMDLPRMTAARTRLVIRRRAPRVGTTTEDRAQAHPERASAAVCSHNPHIIDSISDRR